MITNGYLNLGELFEFEFDEDNNQYVNKHVLTNDEKKAIKDYVNTGTRKPVLVCTNGIVTDGTDFATVSPNLFYAASVVRVGNSYYVKFGADVNGAIANMETSFVG